MDPEQKRLLEENLRISKENNQMLKKMHRIAKWARVARIVYWLILIGAAVGAFYFIQPYIDQVMDLYQGAANLLP